MVVSCWHETDGSLRLLLSAVPVFNEFCYMLIATSCCSQLHRIRRYPISAVAMSRRVGLTVCEVVRRAEDSYVLRCSVF